MHFTSPNTTLISLYLRVYFDIRAKLLLLVDDDDVDVSLLVVVISSVGEISGTDTVVEFTGDVIFPSSIADIIKE